MGLELVGRGCFSGDLILGAGFGGLLRFRRI